ncbi:glycosyl transferase family 2 [Shimia abyssi]|uniref:Glycosyl transferase family 2 n=1 Tax=Shimia abyssi TaxID=1662395 RepID=A0A2P8F9G3_9RHOB|nr:glycosyl transferase family 2 [Shimia abyssi]
MRYLLETFCTVLDEPRPKICIADNGQKPLAHVVEAFRDRLTIHYSVFPEPSLSPVRNQVMKSAINLNTKYIACIDDDEWPSPQWLPKLLRAARDTNAEFVSGPVLADRKNGLPKWLEKGGLLDTDAGDFGGW